MATDKLQQGVVPRFVVLTNLLFLTIVNMGTPSHSKVPTTKDAELSGKTAVVSGSSSGIGRAIAIELASAGAAIVVHGRSNRSGAKDTEKLIRTQGGDALSILGDVARLDWCPQFVEEAWAWRNGVDIWINNAGADVLTGKTAHASFDRKLDLLWRVDVRATIALSRLIGNRMANRGGSILNIGWDQAWRGMAGESGEMFAASKGAIMSFTLSLAQSLAPTVRVNCLAPGWIQTKWGDKASEEWQTRARTEALVNRWGQPEDVAHVARFVVGPHAQFLNGQIVNINGGVRTGPLDRA